MNQQSNQNAQGLAQIQRVRQQLKQLSEQSKIQRETYGQLEKNLLEEMKRHNKRYVDASGEGKGPFICMGKKKMDGKTNYERKVMFWAAFLQQVNNRNGALPTPEQCIEHEKKFLRQFDRRELQIVFRATRPPRSDIADLLEWLRTGSEPQASEQG